jgi:hypothetical protein
MHIGMFIYKKINIKNDEKKSFELGMAEKNE